MNDLDNGGAPGGVAGARNGFVAGFPATVLFGRCCCCCNFSLFFLTDCPLPTSRIRLRMTLHGRFCSGVGHGVRHSGHSRSAAAFFFAYKS